MISLCTATSPVVSECYPLDDRGVRGGQPVDPQAAIHRLPGRYQPGTGSQAIVGPAPPPLKRQAFRPRGGQCEQAVDTMNRRRMRRLSTQGTLALRGRFLRSTSWAVFNPQGHEGLFPQTASAGINPAIVISAETSPVPSIFACSGVGGGPVFLFVLRIWGVWLNSRRGSGGALHFCSV